MRVSRLVLCAVMLCGISICHAQGISSIDIHTANDNHLAVPLYKSGIMRLPAPAKRISVGNPGVADILMLRSEQLYVVAKAIGNTNVVIWDRNDQVMASVNLEVTHDLETLKRKLHDLIPGEPVQVASAQERIVLSGQLADVQKMNAAIQLAEGFLPECIAAESNITVTDTSKAVPVVIKQGGEGGRGGGGGCKKGSVVNLMQVGGSQQVMMEVKVAEIARTVLKRMDADVNIMRFDQPWKFGAVNGGATFPNAVSPDGLEIPIFGDLSGSNSPIGPVVDRFEPSTGTINDTGYFMSWLGSKMFIEAVLEISRQKGLAKILAEPTLTALTGQEARFLSGGEFPIPVASGDDAVTVEFKEFGVGVNFLPIVLNSGQINLTLNVSVSEISQANNVLLGVPGTASAFAIPSLTKRSAGTTVELADGQTIGIAGLISDNLREFVDKLPGLGDLPVLGTLFRSQEFASGQTELVIFVTPRLAKPINKRDIKLPTDNFVPPNDLEFYLLGKLEGRKGNAPQSEPAAESSSAEAPQAQGAEVGKQFGHEL
jgi:pilus assembly protein CpaC